MPGDAQEVAEKQKQQTRDVRSACGCLLLFLGVIAALAAFAPLLRRASVRGDGSISIANFNELSGGILYIAAFTLILLFAALAARSTTRMAIGLLVVVTLSAAFSYGFVYRRFVALAVDGNEVRLSFVWPRPPRVIDARTILSTEVVHATESEGDSVHLYRLEITAGQARWSSQPTSRRAVLDRLQIMLEQSRLRNVRPGPKVTICGHAEASTTDFDRASVIIRDDSAHRSITVVIPPSAREAFASTLGSSPARAYLGKSICATGTMTTASELLVTVPSDVKVSQ